MKKIFLLGSTGSIGTNTLEVVSNNPDYFQVVTLVANRNIDLLAKQISQYKPKNAVIYDKESFLRFKNQFDFPNTNIINGKKGLQNLIEESKYDVFVNAFVGFAGLEPTVLAIKSRKDVALANKETLVVAGELINTLAKKYCVNILPIDSEHSAIWQCLVGEKQNKIKRIILTASGGPFRNKDIRSFKSITVSEALNHPNWKMGAKITIDSATLMNKGLEVIEAYWLYNVPLDKIDVVIHPQSIIHSMVEFEDNSVKAQMGIPDMKIPIQYALSYPERLKLDVLPMDFQKYNTLTFEEPDLVKFPCLKLAYDALRMGGSYPAVLNAANEEAVNAFLKERISFTDIPEIIEQTLGEHKDINALDIQDYIEIDKQSRKVSGKFVNSKIK